MAQHVEVESGKRSDRPELAKALAAAKKGRATLLIGKLDRLARNVTFIAGLMDAGIDFVVCDQLFASRLTLHILAAVAEDEARRTSERTKAALAAAKARGVKLGSPRAAETAVIARAARSAYATKANATTRLVIGEIQRSGISTLLGIAKTLEARGVRTPAGSRWRRDRARSHAPCRRRDDAAGRHRHRRDQAVPQPRGAAQDRGPGDVARGGRFPTAALSGGPSFLRRAIAANDSPLATGQWSA